VLPFVPVIQITAGSASTCALRKDGTVTAGNASAVQLYERLGFVRYGTLRRALRIGTEYHDKLHMALML